MYVISGGDWDQIMAEPESLAPGTVIMAGQPETILIVASAGKQIHRLQRELRDSGYLMLAATEVRKALHLLSAQAVQLVVVIAHSEWQLTAREEPSRTRTPANISDPSADTAEQENYAILRAVQPVAAAGGIPILLVSSLWSESALAEPLASGADYFLFAPYQPLDLLRAIRETLLNGPTPEPAGFFPDVKLIHRDRTHIVKAGRSQLARLGFSLLEELRQCRATLSWNQAEVQELRRQLRQQREQAPLARMLPELVQGIAHDFSNLLETVSAAATVLRSGPSQPAPYRDALNAALAQAGMLVATLQNWTEWEEDGARTESVDLAAAVHEVMEAALLPLRAPNIRVRLQVQGLPPVQSDRSLLFRTLSNLVWNAVQAMPAGGMLNLLGHVQRNRVVLEVSDTGVGIPEKDQEKIFSSHFSTKHGHTGIGLALVRSLVRGAGGDITVASRPGRGSTFSLSFPIARSEPVVAEGSRSASRKIATRSL